MAQRMNGAILFTISVFGLIPSIFVAQAIVELVGQNIFSTSLIFAYCFSCVSGMIIGAIEKDAF